MSGTNKKIASPNDFDDTDEGKQQYWRSEIESAKKELKKWQDSGKKVVKIYLDNRSQADTQSKNFNLFAANTGILKSALYERIPKPEVSRRNRDFDDDVSRVASSILERAMSYEIDNDPVFDTIARNIIEDRLIPGLGAAWVRYDATTEEQEIQITDDVAENYEDDTQTEPQTQTVITDEAAAVDYVHWNDFFWSPARTWSEVRWVARRVYMNKDELIDRFGDEKATLVDMSVVDDLKESSVAPKNTVIQQGEVFEIWDKTSKTVVWLSLSSSAVLDRKDDPLNLPNFFPCPKPLIANATTSNFMPKADYGMVEDQYSALNDLNDRIYRITEACKVAGVYDKSAEAVGKLLIDSRENILIPVDRWASFAEKGGMAGVISFLPIRDMAEVLTLLERQREAIKAQIYELTGISDIIRGASNPYETAAAQNLKGQYASQRLGALQHEVARFFEELVAMKAHLMVKFYEPERLLARCGMINQVDQQFILPAIQLLQNEQLSHFRIVVSVDALQTPNLDGEKSQRIELVSAVSAFIEKALPAAQHTPEIAPMLMSMLKFSIAGFRQAKDLEGIIDAGIAQLQAAQTAAQGQPKQPTPAQMEFQLKQQKQQQDFQLAQAELQLKSNTAANDFAVQQATLQLKAKEVEIEAAKFSVNTQLTAIANQTEATLQSRALDIKAEHTHLSNINAFHNTALKERDGMIALDTAINNNEPSNLLGGL